MSLYIIAIFVLLRENAINSNVALLRSRSDTMERLAILEEIYDYHGFCDKRVQNYYRSIWMNRGVNEPGQNIKFFVDELTLPRFYCKETKTTLLEYVSKNQRDAYTMIPYLYHIRHGWWGDQEFVNALNRSLRAFYLQVWDETKAPTGKRSQFLVHWVDMCKHRAMVGDKDMWLVMESNIHDTRRLSDLQLPNPFPPKMPVPGRVCDEMLLSLFTLGEMDIPNFFALHGYREIPMREYQERVTSLYDQMIRDYPAIKKQYLTK
jgi:hypothetical protein